MLPTVPETEQQQPAFLSALAVPSGSGSGSDALGRRRGGQQLAPWQSPAISELAQCVGRGRPEASPLLVEGPTGTVIAAIGEERDHAVAGRALRGAMVQPQMIAKPQALGGPSAPSASHRGGRGGAVAAAGGGLLAAGNRNVQRHGASFGAVYEYRDASGKPRFVGGTGEQPEARYADDFEQHAAVRGCVTGDRTLGTLASARSAANVQCSILRSSRLFEAGVDGKPAGGRATVVWAAVGGGPCGDVQMAAARDAVVHERAQRQQIRELSGAKPYSRHSHMLA